jgi:uncharacterized protein
VENEKFLDILQIICKNEVNTRAVKGENPLLLQFSIKNFRSFEKEEVLSLSAGKGSELRDSNTFEFSQNQHLVRSAVIYGPNAGGKSNLIRAIFFCSSLFSHLQLHIKKSKKSPYNHFDSMQNLKMNQVSFLSTLFVMMFVSLIM